MSERPPGPLAVLESRIKNLLIEQASLADRLARSQEREQEERGKLLCRFLEVADLAGTYAAEREGDPSPAARYLQELERLVARILAEAGVHEVPGPGHPADPRYHRVVEAVPGAGRPAGTILKEYRKAYLWNGALLREGQVVVSDDGNGG
ncbi:MAG: nucleotide exchange factor GrpE [Planctomycetes bacterium]|nr:nucleotide exchange factor GrpE [Planctomycetota bacterium]